MAAAVAALRLASGYMIGAMRDGCSMTHRARLVALRDEADRTLHPTVDASNFMVQEARQHAERK